VWFINNKNSNCMRNINMRSNKLNSDILSFGSDTMYICYTKGLTPCDSFLGSICSYSFMLLALYYYSLLLIRCHAFPCANTFRLASLILYSHNHSNILKPKCHRIGNMQSFLAEIITWKLTN
jgi:hypothetical protein